MKLLGKIKSCLLNPPRSKNCRQFHLALDMANEIALTNPLGLRDIIRALLRPLQSEHILAVAERVQHQAPSEIESSSFFFSNPQIFSYEKHWIRDAPKIELNLACDPILPTPWERGRYANALASIGPGKALGEWRQDPNHSVSLWLPWGIGFVNGGNHSISSGILAGEKSLVVASEVFDFSPVLNLVECDGIHYRLKSTREVLAEVSDHRRAAVFEIGRLLVKYNR